MREPNWQFWGNVQEVVWHLCRGKTWRPWSILLCSCCDGERHGSFDVTFSCHLNPTEPLEPPGWPALVEPPAR